MKEMPRSALCVFATALLFGAIGFPAMSSAADWLAPAPELRIQADWVQDVANTMSKNRFKTLFENQAFGCDQCRILEYLNDAADALDSGEPKLAKSFVRRALRVLDDGVQIGWYDEDDVQPIKRLILQKANEGLKEADAGELAFAVPKNDQPSSAAKGGHASHGRWKGYTDGSRYGVSGDSGQESEQRKPTAKSEKPDSQTNERQTFRRLESDQMAQGQDLVNEQPEKRQ